uniref:MIF4G domain-containing protein n=1 Tax=Globodera pallida TaxID=36090 RepID=A0A183BKB4_GLOPA
MHSHFSRFQFFFDPPHIQQLAKSDRRFLQRIFREKSHANVDAFYAIDCEEAELPKKFRQLYEAVLKADGSATRAYQLIVNSLTQYYSRITWATSVQKQVIKFLEDSILSKFQDLGGQLIGQKSLFELELVCLLELFVLRYASNCVNEDTIFELLTNIREKGGEEHMSAFVNDHIVNHFGFSLEHRLRPIVERLDLKVKAFRGDQPFSSSAGVGRRKLSLHTLERASEVGNGGRGGSSGKGNSSEPTRSSVSTNTEEEEDGVGEQQSEAKVGISSSTGRRQQQHRRNGRHSSSVGGTDGGGEEQKEAEEVEEAVEERSPSPPAKRLRSGSNAFCTTASNKRSPGKPKFVVIDTSEESTGSSSSTSGTTSAATAATAESSSMATHRIPLTRSVTANAIVSSSSSSSRGRRRPALSPTKKATTNIKKILSSPVPSGARPSMASIDVRHRY